MAGLGSRQTEHQNEMIAAMERFEWDMHDAVGRAGRLPPEWREIWEAKGAPKTRMTLRLDADVVRFFKSMGAGYGPRMNSVLRSFMLARLAGLIRHGDLAGKYRETWMEKPRPSPATRRIEVQRMMTDMEEMIALTWRIVEADKTGKPFTAKEAERLDFLSARYVG
ncbi:BrnA antitoxin family protein [Jannaschia pohangensis]|uniref:BrnA antitoxin of type II toxin-antitoxin system n=1 Tax=Jannaschia pohangensis TaxID=390807 RepID=A0A1I3LWU5_9RHOB|nr:BrnA antitoxin family protein [Jannaschia pohangensis]SFI89137.1 BrnA antitoxin of type II toxin-antitoxin system [Jannaschia pohangensis]